MSDNKPAGVPPPEVDATPVSGEDAVRFVVDNAKPAKRIRAAKAGNQKTDHKGRPKGTAESGGTRRRRPPSRNTILSQLDDFELWHDRSGEAFATAPVNGHLENWAIRSGRFRSLVIGRYYDATKGAPSAQALEEVLRVLEARAIRGPEHQAFLRVGQGDNAVYLDLATSDWQAVEITSAGWSVVPEAPVRFIRSPQMRPLPVPEPGGSIEDLGDFLNMAIEADLKLAVVWLLSALRPRGPYPLLILNGEQGSSKSTASRVLRTLIDSNAAPIRSAPRDERDLAVSAWNSWNLVYDNLSGLPVWLSDALCRLATGGGFGTRQLHSDREEVVFDSERPVILNGIPDLAARPDLADRSIGLVLPAIPREKRRPESEFWATFKTARPFILGALLDGLVGALRHLPDVRLEELPRMADFAIFGVAVERALGWPEGSFLEAYKLNRSDAILGSLEASPLAQALIEHAKACNGTWEGTASELLAALEQRVSERICKSRAWPQSPSALGNRLRRDIPLLRSQGVEIAMERVGATRKRLIFLKGKPVERG